MDYNHFLLNLLPKFLEFVDKIQKGNDPNGSVENPDKILNLSQTKVNGNISVNNPNYNYSDNALKAALDVSSTDRSNSSGFKSSKTGFMAGTSFEQYNDIYFSPSIESILLDVGINPTQRAEEIGLEQFCALSKKIN